MFLLKIFLHLPISKLKSKFLSIVFNILMIWLISVVRSFITAHTRPALQPCYILSHDRLSVPLHILCLDVFPFFVLLGMHILLPRLGLDIISFLSICFKKYVPLT